MHRRDIKFKLRLPVPWWGQRTCDSYVSDVPLHIVPPESAYPLKYPKLTAPDALFAALSAPSTRILGRGLMGTVYDLGDGTIIKRIPYVVTEEIENNDDEHSKVCQEFYTEPYVDREVTILSALSKTSASSVVPSFLGVYNDTRHSSYMIHMTRVGEGDLASSRRHFEGNMGSYTALREALKHAIRLLHAAGVTHNDLKFENIMVGTGPRVWFIDFGHACLEGAADRVPKRRVCGLGMAPDFKDRKLLDGIALATVLADIQERVA